MPPVTVIDEWGKPHTLEGDALSAALDRGWTPESGDAAAARIGSAAVEDSYSGVGDKVDAYAAGVARGFTGGLSDAGLSAIGGDATKRHLRGVRGANPVTSIAGELVGNVTGAVTGVGPMGEVSALGAALARSKAGAGAASRIGRAALGGAVEGGLQEVGAGLSDIALSEDPVSMDRIASDLTSRFLYGGAVGGVAGGALRGLEVGLSGARRKLAAAKEAADQVGGVPDDLVALDRKGLRAAEKAELEAIETARVPERSKLAGEVSAYRESTLVDKPWEAIEVGARGSDAAKAAPAWMRRAKKLGFEADKSIDRALRNPKLLAEEPMRVKAALQQQEHALELILEKADELKVLHATDTTGRRAAALELVAPALEQNRALQRRIGDLTAKPGSARLAAITDALDTVGDRGSKTLGQQMAGGAAYGVVSDLVRSVPILGPIAAPLIGARVADAISGKLGGQLAAVTRGALERTTKAVDGFLAVTRKAQRVAPALSTKVLAAARFAVEGKKPDGKPKSLEQHYDDRVAEISSSVAPDPTGVLRVRPNVRQQIAQRLSPLAHVSPHVADRLETHAVKRLELIANKMPKTTLLGMTRMRPSEMAIRAWARYIAAADDPGAIEERLADGTITPEDAEVMRELYPDRMAEITRRIVEKLPELRKTLPYHRRLALSIFTGQPVDAAMEPHILAALQASFADEAHTEGGTQAPRPQPAFGSVKKSIPSPTPAQERAG